MREQAIAYLSGLLGVPENLIGEALILTDRYRLAKIPKASGGFRRIATPLEPLKYVQRLILDRILPLVGEVYGFRFMHWAHGFMAERSIKTNTGEHFANRFVLRVDLEDAFGNVRREHYDQYLGNLCDALAARRGLRFLSRQMAMHTKTTGCGSSPAKCGICANNYKRKDALKKRTGENPRLLSYFEHRFFYDQPFGEWWRFGKPGEWENFIREIGRVILDLCFFRGCLPQGAPTSPALLNFAYECSGLADRLDRLEWKSENGYRDLVPAMSAWDEERKALEAAEGAYSFPFTWTVYADDFIFSGGRPFTTFRLLGDDRPMSERIIATIEECGRFKVNRDKLRHFDAHSCVPLVTGLRLTAKGLALPKARARFLRSLIHHASRDKERRNELAGHLAFLQMIYGKDLPRQFKLKL